MSSASYETTPTNNSSDTYRHSYTIRPAQTHDLPHLSTVERSASSAFLTPSDPALALIADDEPMSAEAHQEHIDSWMNHHVLRTIDHRGDEAQKHIGTGTWVAVAHDRSIAPSGEVGGDAAVVGFIVTSLLEVYHDDDDDEDEAKHVGGGKRDTGTGRYFVHVHELSVHVAHQRRGVAKRLINAVKECARWIDAASRSGGESGRDAVEYGGIRGESVTEVVGLSLTTFRDVAFNAPFYERCGFRELGVERIKEVMGEDGWVIWEEERDRFTAIGDGKLAERRCWMVCC